MQLGNTDGTVESFSWTWAFYNLDLCLWLINLAIIGLNPFFLVSLSAISISSHSSLTPIASATIKTCAPPACGSNELVCLACHRRVSLFAVILALFLFCEWNKALNWVSWACITVSDTGEMIVYVLLWVHVYETFILQSESWRIFHLMWIFFDIFLLQKFEAIFRLPQEIVTEISLIVMRRLRNTHRKFSDILKKTNREIRSHYSCTVLYFNSSCQSTLPCHTIYWHFRTLKSVTFNALPKTKVSAC